VIDATSGITAQDAHIAGFVLEAWKSTVVLVNKWDAIEKDTFTMEQYTTKIRAGPELHGLRPHLFISAKTGQRVDQVLPLALQVQEERLARLTTSRSTGSYRILRDASPTSSRSGKHFDFTMARTKFRNDPPTFLLYGETIRTKKTSHTHCAPVFSGIYALGHLADQFNADSNYSS